MQQLLLGHHMRLVLPDSNDAVQDVDRLDRLVVVVRSGRADGVPRGKRHRQRYTSRVVVTDGTPFPDPVQDPELPYHP
ncbi:hypothetical protein, partial [Streptomyces milbemycinicus]